MTNTHDDDERYDVPVMQLNVLNREESFDERMDSHIRQVLDERPGILLMQEVLTDRLDDVAAKLDRIGYGSIADPQGALPNHEPDCALIAWDRGIFGPVDGWANPPHPTIDVAMAKLTHAGTGATVLAASYHGHWGATGQHARLTEVRRLDAMMRGEQADVRLLGGDFNATPGEEAFRWLIGDGDYGNDDEATYWMDAQRTRRQLIGTEPEPTSRNTGAMAVLTASRQHIDTRYMPARTIDHIMINGWNYGKNAYWLPETIHTGGDPDTSDHCSLTAVMGMRTLPTE